MRIVKSIATSALALTTMAAIAQSDQQGIHIFVDSQPVDFGGHRPIESNGRILVPLRGVFQRLGAHVNWDPSTQTVTASREGSHVKIGIGQLDASVNGHDTRMDVPATLVDGATMVPLRFVSEALGAFVGWNPDTHEVDIKSTVDYNLPRPTPPPPPPPPTPPPPPPAKVIIETPPPPPPVVERPLRIERNYREVTADTVIPLTLDSHLSSRDSKPGDAFTATVDTESKDRYLSLPAGTQAFGTVTYVKRQHRREPGVVELRFDHLMLPNGRKLPVSGRLIGMDAMNVTKDDDGRFVAKNAERGNTSVFVAFGKESAFVTNLPTDRPLKDSMINALLAQSLDSDQRSRLAHDADLQRGTRMGLRLYESLIVPNDEK